MTYQTRSLDYKQQKVTMHREVLGEWKGRLEKEVWKKIVLQVQGGLRTKTDLMV